MNYTNERNHQILISLLKSHNIKNIIASPGMTNSVFVGSVQDDPFFRIYSCVDERSACYMACGLSLETNEPVVVSCTGATASRNYMPGATEAYYSKLPILILTSSQPNRNIGHLCAQVTDRTSPPNDTCLLSLELPTCTSKDDEWHCEVQVNKALTELRRAGGGPVHLNLITTYSFTERTALTAKELPSTRMINRILLGDELPQLEGSRHAIFIGAHKPMDRALTERIEAFCEANNAVVLCDHTSNYHGKYAIPFALSINQSPLNKANIAAFEVDTLIHIGEISGEEGAARMIKSKQTWRVSEDGEMRDYFRNLRFVFEMSESSFFATYGQRDRTTPAYYQQCQSNHDQLKLHCQERLGTMPFSNVWIAQRLAGHIPADSTVVLSILNTLRTWNYADFDRSVKVYCPVGGFGIDGASSMLVGASLGRPDKLFFGVTGDLAFFYDLNSLGNRHVGNNIRILLVNNGLGFEFKKTYAMAYRLMGDEVERYVAASGHFGKQSALLVRHFAEDLGFEYMSARSKEEFEANVARFVSSVPTERSILFECFVNADDESTALNIIHNR